ncbi:hypothetical protein [Acidisoma sp. 7E03]
MDKRRQLEMVVQPMQIGDVRPVFPLIQARDPSLLWSRWQSYAKRVARSKPGAREGVLVARRGSRALPCGAACYRLDQDLRFGHVLTVEHLVAIDLFHPQAVRAALAVALEGVAHGLGCDVIRAILPEQDVEAAEELRLSGHRPDGRTLTKQFEP